MLLQQKRDNKFIFILFISILFHIGIIIGVNLKFHKLYHHQDYNRIEINLNEYNLHETLENYEAPQLNEPIIKEENIPKEKNFKIEKKINIKNEKIEKINISNLTEISSNIPLTFPVKKSKSSLKALSNPNKIGKKTKNRIKRANSNKAIMQYLLQIKDKVKKNTLYPLIARKRELEGEAIIEFELLKNGEIKNLKIIKSSGYGILDNAAKKSVLNSVPFPKFPKNLAKTSLIIRLPIEFRLEN